jgi:hypothetical protein
MRAVEGHDALRMPDIQIWWLSSRQDKHYDTEHCLLE